MTLEEFLEVEALLHELTFVEEAKEMADRLHVILSPTIEERKRRALREQHGIKNSWEGFHPENRVQDALTTLSGVMTLYTEADIEEKKLNLATTDLLHAFELAELDDDEYIRLGKELRDLRLIRRRAKDFIEMVSPLYAYGNKHRGIIKELGKVHAEMMKTRERLEKRIYTVKDRDLNEKTSLQEAFDRSNPILASS